MHQSDPADDGHPSALRVALAWLAHPVSVAGIGLLLLNDHVLKAEYGTWLTGKLSDVAGLVFAPALLAVVVAVLAPTARPRTVATASCATVGLAFALVKATTTGAAVASAAWTAIVGPSVVRVDVTDLLALPALALTWWGFRQAQRRPFSGRVAYTLRLAVVLPIAVLATAATTLEEHPPPRRTPSSSGTG
jgi:hypothetical protein